MSRKMKIIQIKIAHKISVKKSSHVLKVWVDHANESQIIKINQ